MCSSKNKFMRLGIVALMMLFALGLFACEDSGLVYDGPPADGDGDADGDLPDGDEDTGHEIFFMGNGSGDGNPAIITMGFDVTDGTAFVQPVRWSQVRLQVDGLFLSEAPTCSVTDGTVLDSRSGAAEFTFGDEGKRLMRFEAPTDRNLCALDFKMPAGGQNLIARGKASSGQEVELRLSMDDVLPMVFSRVMKLEPDAAVNWVLLFDAGDLLPEGWEDAARIDGTLAIIDDAIADKALLREILARLIAAMRLIVDGDGDGQASESEISDSIATGSQERSDEYGQGRPDRQFPACVHLIPGTLDFGTINEGDASELQVGIYNDCPHTDIEVFSTEMENDNEWPCTWWQLGDPLSVDAHDYEDLFSLSCSPDLPGEYRNTWFVEVRNLDTDELAKLEFDVSIDVIGDEYPEPEDENCIVIAPTSVDFGTVEGSTNVSRSVKIQNNCNWPISWTDTVAMDGVNTDFLFNEMIDDGEPAIVLDAGESIDLDLAFNPQTPGEHWQKFRFEFVHSVEDTLEQLLIDVHASVPGEAPYACLSMTPSFIDFGMVEQHSDKRVQVIVANNCDVGYGSMATMHFGDNNVLVEDGSPFGTSPFLALEPGESATLDAVAYGNDELGSFEGMLFWRMRMDDGGYAYLYLNWELEVVETLPVLESKLHLSPADLAFSDVFVGHSKVLTVEVENMASNGMDIARIWADNPAFYLLGDTPDSIGSGDLLQLTIAYEPNDVASDVGILTIEDETGTQTEIALSGTGISMYDGCVEAELVENGDASQPANGFAAAALSSNDAGLNFSGGLASQFEGTAVNDYAVFSFDVPEARSYMLNIVFATHSQAPQIQITANGTVLGSEDLYAETKQLRTVTVGPISLDRQQPLNLMFSITGQNANATGMFIEVDAICLTPEVAGNSCPTAEIRDEYNQAVVSNLVNMPPETELCFNAYGRDVDGQISAYQWSGDPTFVSATDEDRVCVTTAATSAEEELHLRVQDNEGCWSDLVTIQWQTSATSK